MHRGEAFNGSQIVGWWGGLDARCKGVGAPLGHVDSWAIFPREHLKIAGLRYQLEGRQLNGAAALLHALLSDGTLLLLYWGVVRQSQRVLHVIEFCSRGLGQGQPGEASAFWTATG